MTTKTRQLNQMTTNNNSGTAVKQVIVMRTDLNMRKGKMAAQGGHSVEYSVLGENFMNRIQPDGTLVLKFSKEEVEWLMSGSKKVVVGCDSHDELEALYSQAKNAGLTVHMVVDSGFTEFRGVPTSTCLAIGPHYNEKVDPITGKLRLL